MTQPEPGNPVPNEPANAESEPRFRRNRSKKWYETKSFERAVTGVFCGLALCGIIAWRKGGERYGNLKHLDQNGPLSELLA